MSMQKRTTAMLRDPRTIVSIGDIRIRSNEINPRRGLRTASNRISRRGTRTSNRIRGVRIRIRASRRRTRISRSDRTQINSRIRRIRTSNPETRIRTSNPENRTRTSRTNNNGIRISISISISINRRSSTSSRENNNSRTTERRIIATDKKAGIAGMGRTDTNSQSVRFISSIC